MDESFLLVLARISSSLGIIWFDHALGIAVLGAYLTDELWPAIEDLAGGEPLPLFERHPKQHATERWLRVPFESAYLVIFGGVGVVVRERILEGVPDDLRCSGSGGGAAAAAHLRVSVWAVYDAVNAGALHAIRVGRAIRIPATPSPASPQEPSRIPPTTERRTRPDPARPNVAVQLLAGARKGRSLARVGGETRLSTPADAGARGGFGAG